MGSWGQFWGSCRLRYNHPITAKNVTMIQPSPLRSNRVVLLLALFLLSSSLAQAQAQVRFESLLVEIWPEFDRAETLVIYRGQLQTGTDLPARLTFSLPGYIKEMNAVAYAQGNTLVSVPAEEIEQTTLDDRLRLTFTTASPTIQLEYYDSQILSQQGARRSLDFNFTAPYAIETTTFEFQAPVQAQNFSLEPAATETFTDTNGLVYALYNVADLAGGDTASFQASYQRPTNQVSVEFLTANIVPEHAEEVLPALPLTPTPTIAPNQILAFVLAGLGACLLVGVGIIWWFDRRRLASGPAQNLQRSPHAEPPRHRLATTDPPQTTTAEFCFNCGVKLRPEANFCHGCGSPRRA